MKISFILQFDIFSINTDKNLFNIYKYISKFNTEIIKDINILLLIVFLKFTFF